MSGAPQAWLDELVAWATPEATKADLLAAREAYFARTGEIFDEDRQFEMRMAAFLEHYVCDRPAPHFGVTPARRRYELALREETPARAAAFRAFTETLHGLFEVERLGQGAVRLAALFSGLTFEVTERRQIVGLQPGDVIECRLVPFEGHVHFSPAYCFHPHEVAAVIRAEARRRRAERGASAEPALVDECAQRSLKVDRYRQIDVEKIYGFGAPRP